ncbi:MAG: biphenyl 2,3-dioxygenase beta subunit [Chloroflexi bacterium]|jgi:3-phenylpropionate/cinnamic acid dioxygenase small subunit|nr:MAG: biphenyl 2,3-dioxygenase beta subunit [Chloroflexota bacterium]
MSHELWHEVEAFLALESRLLDEQQFEEWLDLFSEDATYRMPLRMNPWRSSSPKDGVTKPGELLLFDDTKDTLKARVARLRTGLAWREIPASRTRHLITNIEVEQLSDSSELIVLSNFLVYRTQLERDRDFFVGSRKDTLCRIDGALKIAKRELLLDDVVLPAKNLSIFF